MFTSIHRWLGVLLLLNCALPPQSALADPPRPAGWGAPKEKPHAQVTDGTITKIKEPIQIANVPTFTGHTTFVWGTIRQTTLGEGWMEFFKCKERQKDVYDWYKQVLPMQQWKIIASNDQQMMAKYKDGSTVTVNTQQLHGDKAGNSILELSYFVPKKPNQ
jgi:hypothetical protein